MGKPSIISLLNKVAKKQAQYNKVAMQLNEVKQELVDFMGESDLESISNDVVKVAYVPAATTMSFDSARFKAEHEDLYTEYSTKESVRKAAVRVTIKEQLSEESCTTKK